MINNQEKNAINAMFPEFHFLYYESLEHNFEIDIPSFIRRWLNKVLHVFENINFSLYPGTHDWMTLLYPSLLLMTVHTQEWSLISSNIIRLFQDYRKNSAKANVRKLISFFSQQ